MVGGALWQGPQDPHHLGGGPAGVLPASTPRPDRTPGRRSGFGRSVVGWARTERWCPPPPAGFGRPQFRVLGVWIWALWFLAQCLATLGGACLE